MGKSLTETAKAVLMKESNDMTPDRDAKSMNPNKATLRPGSGPMEPSHMTNAAQDLGPAAVKPTDVPPSAKAAMGTNKDTSPSSQTRKGAVPPEKSKPQAEVMEEDVETDEIVSEGSHAPKNEKKEENEAIKRFFKNGRKINKLPAGKAGGLKEENETEDAVNLEEDEDIEISEELESFIDNLVAEGLSDDEIIAAIEENFEFISEEEENSEVVSEDNDEGSLENHQVDMSEHVNALLEGEDLSEEFKTKATTIFESAVKVKLAEEVALIEKAFADTLAEQVAQIKSELSENVDDYLNYVVEQWISDNEVAVESGLRTELTEEFISGLRNLFAENYIDIPEDKISVIEEMGSKIQELEGKLNEEIERNVHLLGMINESKKDEIILSACEGLTTTQSEKLKSLAEDITFSDVKEFAEKVVTLRENYFPVNVNSDNVLDSDESISDGKSMISEDLKGPMAQYVRVLGKKLPN